MEDYPGGPQEFIGSEISRTPKSQLRDVIMEVWME
jgi:hypothetical protein